MTLALRYAVQTDVGLVRTKNDDSAYVGPHLLALADGMGGAVGGDVASAITISTVYSLDNDKIDDLLPALGESVLQANTKMAERIEATPELEGMGTTLTAILFDGQRFGLAHIGDSRAYLLRDETLRQLSHDHTFVRTLVDEGRLTEAEARQHPHRNLIMRVLQGHEDAEPDLAYLDLQLGDRLLICSDGLTDFVEDSEIAHALINAGEPDDVANELIRMTLEVGAPDNVTCVVADVVESDDPQAAGQSGAIFVGAAAAADQLEGPAEITASQEPTTIPHPDPDEDEELRYRPREPGRFRWVLRTIVALVVLTLIGFVGWNAYGWSQRQFYVGAYTEPDSTTAPSETHVAIFKGIAQHVPGLQLTKVYEVQELQTDALPPYHREKVEQTISVDDLAGAQAIVKELNQIAQRCAPTTPPRTTSPSTTPSASTSPQAGGTTSPRPTNTLRPATPSGTAQPNASLNGGLRNGATELPPDCAGEVTSSPDPGATR
ncbi:PP2C family protein-serine/threonine phosphatase [Tenggerimyces flavus]|uniref:PP2C family protein-serine/threonine phosphatase n=1 Tax=Tenggerimyces flavus TaxID=1708749 RepID=A0ABV7YRU6_9ACTN|nr:PP2C family serine/threonine-protein phosphatase [Tenggerimyces flavus]MBM7784416.1 protein phosphatase [Tenggerimyces flavus]